MYFRSKYGPILTTIILMAVVVILIPAVLLGSAVSLIYFIISAFILWVFFGTGYYFLEDRLVITSGPFKWRIKYVDIKSISPTKDPTSAPASSIDRLNIVYSLSKSICVSPKDREGFIRVMRSKCPSANIRIG